MDKQIPALIFSEHSFIYLLYLLIFFVLLLLYLYQKKKQLRIKRWEKALNIPSHAQIFQQLYEKVNGFLLSRQERQKQDAFEYTYGEIDFLSFIALLSLAKPDQDTVFYDLGSGVGKAVLACAMVFPVQKCIGVELFPSLYQCSCNQVNHLKKISGYEKKSGKIKFILDDFLEVDLNDATLIFINSTALFGPTWENLCSRLDKQPNLNTIITTSKTLISTEFSPVISTKIQMSWGPVLAYIHKRKTNLN